MNNEEIRYGDTIRMCDFVQVYLGVYICVFAAISVISAIIYISTGDMEKIGTNGLELNSMIYVGILGVFGFKEDFKMLIQNGFTRKYIFLATLSLFAFTSAIMAAVDTIVGNALHAVASGYFSLFGGLYGYEHSLLSELAVVVPSLYARLLPAVSVYFDHQQNWQSGIYLSGNRPGTDSRSDHPGSAEICSAGRLCRGCHYVCRQGNRLLAEGAVNFLYPIMSLLLIAGILSIGSYLIIRRTELKV